MGKSFFEDGMKDKKAVFNMFYRVAPEMNNWAVVSGIREVVEMINGIGSETPDFFESFMPGREYEAFRKYISGIHFTGNVYAMDEGEIAFPSQPVITVEAPLIEAQILETPLLAIMNHQMAVATKASRVTRSTTKPVSEFGSRRAHGPWASIYGGKAAVIGGCVNTSNIYTGYEFGVPSSGTMAHSFITAYGCSIKGELNAFRSYIRTHSGENLILLIDTYDSLHCGIKNAMRAFSEAGIDDNYKYGYGIRLDSGDLAYLSRRCRDILDRNGFTKCKIIATNALDEYLITALERQHALIDAYGVGDAIATSKQNPCFGNVYKLVQIDEKPLLKRTEDKTKLVNPGFQITYRIISEGKFDADVTCLRGDKLSRAIEKGETITLRKEIDETQSKTYPEGTYDWKILQHKVIDNGKSVYKDKPLMEKRAYYLNNLASFNETEIRITNPHFYKTDISDDLYDLKNSLIRNLIREIKEMNF
jgi:nicotinate phosphoribosyltransferase